MPALLVVTFVLFALFAIIMIIVASKLVRDNRARSAARIAALQAAVAGIANAAQSAPTPVAAPAPAPEPAMQDETFDLALRRDRPIAEAPQATPPEALAYALFEEPTLRTPSRRWSGMAAAGFLIVVGAGVFFLISSGVIGRAFAARSERAMAAAAAPIELLSLRQSTDASGNFIVTGLVQNPAASTPQRGVFAVVYLFDADGKYFASSRAAIESAVLSPGGEAAFMVQVPASSSPVEVSKYRVSFQHEDGAAVGHVDRRGTLPDQTTGDTVGPASTAAVVTARRD